MSVPPMIDQAKAQEVLANPSADTDSLIAVAYHHPALRPAVAAHPNANPELLNWLDSFGDAAASAAVAARRAQSQPPGPASPPQPGPPAPVEPMAAAPPPVEPPPAMPPPPPVEPPPAMPPPPPAGPPPTAPPPPQADQPPAGWPTGAPASGNVPYAPPAMPPGAYSPAPPGASYSPPVGQPAAGGPADKPKPKRKGLMLGVVAGVVVVVLAVAGFLVVPKLLKSSDSDYWTAPNFLSKPTLSRQYKVTDGLPEDTYLDAVAAPASSDKTPVLLTNGYCGEEDCAFDRWLRVISLTSGEVLWTLDIQDFGLANPRLAWFGSRTDNVIGLAIWSRNDVIDDRDQTINVPGVMAVFNADTGALLSQADIDWALGPDDSIRILALNKGTMVLEPVAGSDGSPMIAGYSTSDLSDEVWSTAAYIRADGLNIDWRTVGDDWVLAPAGYLSVEDGSSAPFGGDVEAVIGSDGEFQSPWVLYTELRSRLLVREAKHDDGSVTCMPWDREKDQAIWDEPADCTSLTIAQGANGNVYAGQGSKRASGSSTIAFSAAGEVLWENPSGTVLGVAGDTPVLAIDSTEGEDMTITMVDPKTGATIKEFTVGADTTRIYGTEVLYVVSEGDSASLEAFSTSADKSDPLWTLSLGQDDKLIRRGTHLLVWNKKGIRLLEG